MEVPIIIALVFLNGVFAMSEIALVTARKSSMLANAKKGSKVAKLTLKLMDEPSRFLSTIQIGITLIGILTGMFSGAQIAEDFAEWMVSVGVVRTYAYPLAQGIIVIIVTFVTIVFGEILPKRIGMSAAERVAMGMSRPMVVLAWIARPFVWMLSKTTDIFVRLFHLEEQEAKVTEDEIKSMIAEGKEDGEVQDVEQDIVERVFSLGDRKVESIMTARNEIVWIDKNMTNREINELVQENLFEVYPVGDGSLDDITGVVFLKNLFGKLENESFSLDEIVRPAHYFHEYMDVYEALEQMKSKSLSYGLICDEFGVFQGIVTYKDILMGLVGNISDDNEEPAIVKRTEGDGWLVDGQCSFYDFLAHFELEDLYEENDYNTVGGLILEELGHIPTTGEHVKWNDFLFEVVDMDGARIDKIIVKYNKNENIKSEDEMDD